MKVFIDTNVILEKFLDREESSIVDRLFALLEQLGHEPLMSVGGFYTMVFVVDKYLKSELGLTGDDRLIVLRRILSDILNTLNVAGHGKDSLLRGINNLQFRDIEDSCQYELAKLHGCEALITINISDYKDADQTRMKVLTPLQFIETVS